MRSRRSSFLIALSIGLLIGTGYPIIDLGLACRAPASEACVWGKAYLPLTLSVSVVFLGGVVTGLLDAVLLRRAPITLTGLFAKGKRHRTDKTQLLLLRP
jgi:hypothetical protein